MPATALVSARLEPRLREDALKVIEGHGYTQSEVIRRVYEYIVVMDDVPEFVKTNEYELRLGQRRDPFDDMLSWLETGPFSDLDLSGLTDGEIARELSDESRFR